MGTGSLRIDENYPEERFGTCLFFAALLGWALTVSGWVGFLQQPPERPRRLAYGGLAIVAFMLPLLSNDLYGLFAYSGLAIRGHDVYTSTQSLPTSFWFSWIGERWRTNLFAYGPIALLSAAWPSVVGENRPFVAIFLLRATWLVPLVAGMELSFRFYRDRPFFQTMLWLNPLVLVQGAGQLHLDVLGLVAVTAGVVAQSKGRPGLGGAIGGHCHLLKRMEPQCVAPWFWLSGTANLRQRLKAPGWGAVIWVLLGVAAYLPLCVARRL